MCFETSISRVQEWSPIPKLTEALLFFYLATRIFFYLSRQIAVSAPSFAWCSDGRILFK